MLLGRVLLERPQTASYIAVDLFGGMDWTGLNIWGIELGIECLWV